MPLLTQHVPVYSKPAFLGSLLGLDAFSPAGLLHSQAAGHRLCCTVMRATAPRQKTLLGVITASLQHRPVAWPALGSSAEHRLKAKRQRPNLGVAANWLCDPVKDWPCIPNYRAKVMALNNMPVTELCVLTVLPCAMLTMLSYCFEGELRLVKI